MKITPFAILLLAALLVPGIRLSAQTTLSGDHIVTGNLGVGTTSTPGNLTITGKAAGSGPNLRVVGPGNVVFENTGSDYSFIWNPGLGSLSVGSSSATGGSSVAMGEGTYAYSDGSVAMGVGASAYGGYSVAMGGWTTANGSWSTAMGNGTYANGSGSTAMGYVTYANGGASTAMGSGTYANGMVSTAMGNETIAGGDYSTAMGYSTQASTYGSVAIGKFNLGESSSEGQYTWVGTDPILEIGNGTDANHLSNALTVYKNGKVNFYNSTSGAATIVLDPNTSQITISGQPLLTSTSTSTQSFTAPSYSFNSGSTNRMTIDSSGNVGIGTSTPTAKLSVTGNLDVGTTATPGNLTVTGKAASSGPNLRVVGPGNVVFENTSSGNSFLWNPDLGSLSVGSSSAPGSYSVALGGGSYALGNGAIALGSGYALSDSSVAIGAWTYAWGNSSVALGVGTSAIGSDSTAMGYLTYAYGGYSTAMGNETNAYGDYSTTMGYSTQASTYGSVAIGKFNLGESSSTGQYTWVGADPIFEIGNGTDSNHRSNALTVYKNGDVTMTGKVKILKRQGDIVMGAFGNGNGD